MINTLDCMALFRKSFIFVVVVFTLGSSSLAAAQSNPEALRRAQMARKRSPILPSTNPSTPTAPALTSTPNVIAPTPGATAPQMQPQPPAAVPQQPLRPAQMAAIAPRISFQNGLLTIVAE